MTHMGSSEHPKLDISFGCRAGAWWCDLTLGGRVFELKGPAEEAEAMQALDVWAGHLVSPNVFSAGRDREGRGRVRPADRGAGAA